MKKLRRLRGGCAELRSGPACNRGAVTLSEFIDSTSSINEALLTGEERVASGADADTEVLNSGHSVINRAASAGNGGFVNRRMTFFFHGDGWVITWARRGKSFRRGVEGRDTATDKQGVNGFF